MANFLERLEFLSNFIQSLRIEKTVCVSSTDESKIILTELTGPEIELFYGLSVVNLSTFVKQFKLVNFKMKPQSDKVIGTPDNPIENNHISFKWGKEEVNLCVYTMTPDNNVDVSLLEDIEQETSIDVELTDYKNILNIKSTYGADKLLFEVKDGTLALIIKNVNSDDEYKRVLVENVECDDAKWLIDPPTSNLNWKICIFPDNNEYIKFKNDDYTIITYNKYEN